MTHTKSCPHDCKAWLPQNKIDSWKIENWFIGLCPCCGKLRMYDNYACIFCWVELTIDEKLILANRVIMQNNNGV